MNAPTVEEAAPMAGGKHAAHTLQHHLHTVALGEMTRPSDSMAIAGAAGIKGSPGCFWDVKLCFVLWERLHLKDCRYFTTKNSGSLRTDVVR